MKKKLVLLGLFLGQMSVKSFAADTLEQCIQNGKSIDKCVNELVRGKSSFDSEPSPRHIFQPPAVRNDTTKNTPARIPSQDPAASKKSPIVERFTLRTISGHSHLNFVREGMLIDEKDYPVDRASLDEIKNDFRVVMDTFEGQMSPLVRSNLSNHLGNTRDGVSKLNRHQMGQVLLGMADLSSSLRQQDLTTKFSTLLRGVYPETAQRLERFGIHSNRYGELDFTSTNRFDERSFRTPGSHRSFLNKRESNIASRTYDEVASGRRSSTSSPMSRTYNMGEFEMASHIMGVSTIHMERTLDYDKTGSSTTGLKFSLEDRIWAGMAGGAAGLVAGAQTGALIEDGAGAIPGAFAGFLSGFALGLQKTPDNFASGEITQTTVSTVVDDKTGTYTTTTSVVKQDFKAGTTSQPVVSVKVQDLPKVENDDGAEPVKIDSAPAPQCIGNKCDDGGTLACDLDPTLSDDNYKGNLDFKPMSRDEIEEKRRKALDPYVNYFNAEHAIGPGRSNGTLKNSDPWINWGPDGKPKEISRTFAPTATDTGDAWTNWGPNSGPGRK